jgi:hypothetical protein
VTRLQQRAHERFAEMPGTSRHEDRHGDNGSECKNVRMQKCKNVGMSECTGMYGR